MKASAIVPSAGSGRRIQKSLKAVLPKPYLEIGGMPVLARTLKNLEDVPEILEIVVACDLRYRPMILKMARLHGITKLKGVVQGGKTRTDSVFRAFCRTNRNIPYVLVHDGVRPFLTSQTISRFLRRVKNSGHDAWAVGRLMVPTVKEVKKGIIVRTVDRTSLWEIETPQVFKRETLTKAYREFHRAPFVATDDASLVEHMGKPVKVFEIRENNMKITTPENLLTARKILESGETRTGWGEDCHRLEPGRPLYLAGVRIPSPWGAKGHSDGDVILHAVVDALLGAVGAGDIGEHFPDTDKRFKGADSRIFIKKALSLAGRAGFGILNVDTTVILQKPKLGAFKGKMRARLAVLLGLPGDAVGVKAKTAEGLGAEGRGEAVTAHAVVTLKRRNS